MKSKIFGYIYIFIGVGIIGLWVMLLSTNQVPELETALAEIVMHIIIEVLMGIMAIISGVKLIKQCNLYREVCLITNGLLIYSVVNSSGYYIQRSNFPMIVMFGLILIFSLVSTYYLSKNKL
jgi:peptidoglycan/LPS O-acetylase OafA/YrhL